MGDFIKEMKTQRNTLEYFNARFDEECTVV